MAIAMPARRRFTVEDYYKMAAAGILHEDDRVELIEGEIIELGAIGFRHGYTVNAFTNLLTHLVPEGIWVTPQNPVLLGTHTEPQPDLAVVRTDYVKRGTHPTPADILFLIEVSDSSLTYDRRTKLPLYARAGIPEVWLADLLHDRPERHTDPGDGIYRTVARVGRGESLASLALPGLVIQADAVFGSP